MWVLLGIRDDTIERDTYVYFIGVFDELSLAKEKIKITYVVHKCLERIMQTLPLP